jgi:hypothetical protein
LAAQQTGVFDLLQQLWPQPRSGFCSAHYLLLAAIHRICQPGPKTEVADWYDRTVLQPLWGFAAERFTSPAFWDCFETLAPEQPFSSIRQRVTRDRIESPRRSLNKPCRSRPWRKCWGWNNSVLPRVGNTMAGSQPVPKTTTYTSVPALRSKLPLALTGGQETGQRASR